MKPIAVVTSHPIQYQTPLFAYLTQHGLPCRVYFLSAKGLELYDDEHFGTQVRWDVPLLKGIECEFPRARGRSGDPLRSVHPELLRKIDGRHHSAVWIHGYREPTAVLAALQATIRSMPVLYRSESTLSTSRTGTRRRVLGVALRRLGVSCLPVGTRNDQFYESLGVGADRRHLVPYVVDNERFAAAASFAARSSFRSNWGIDATETVVTFVGKLVPWKGCELLIEAFRQVSSGRETLLYVGAGELADPIRRFGRSHGLKVLVTGFLNQTEIPHALAASDLMVLPSSHEPWGLAVNEAMAAGLPTVVSDACGCQPDLVVPGLTGEVFRSGDVEDLASKLRSLTRDPERRAVYGANARRRIERWGFEACRQGLISALRASGVDAPSAEAVLQR